MIDINSEELLLMLKKATQSKHLPRVGYGPYYEEWTQQKIQDLIPRLGCDFKLLQDFYYRCVLWREDDKTLHYVKGNSMRQLWLRFYMWREHHMVWDGKGWISENKR